MSNLLREYNEKLYLQSYKDKDQLLDIKGVLNNKYTKSI